MDGVISAKSKKKRQPAANSHQQWQEFDEAEASLPKPKD
jgi:hypothetical protein